jgi:hypothetical protein
MGVGDVIAWALRILANGGGKRQALLNAIAAATVLYLSKKARKVSGPAVAPSCGGVVACTSLSCSSTTVLG